MRGARRERPRAIRWLSISAAIAAINAVGIALDLGLPLLSVVLEKNGVSATMIGLNSAMAGLASIAIAPFCTPFAQRFGVADTMLVAIVVAAASAIGFYFAPQFWVWFPLRVTFHGAITVLFILSEFWINATAPPSRRGLILGIYTTVLSLGFAAGPLLFSVLGGEGVLPFAVGALIILAAAIPTILARHESPVIVNRPSGLFMKFVFLVPTTTAAVLVFGADEAGGFALFPVYSSRIGFSETDGALLLTMIGLGNILFQIPLGMLSDRVRGRRILLFYYCAAVGLLGCLLLPLIAHSWWLLASVLFVWGAVVAGLYNRRPGSSGVAAGRQRSGVRKCGLCILLRHRHAGRPATDRRGNGRHLPVRLRLQPALLLYSLRRTRDGPNSLPTDLVASRLRQITLDFCGANCNFRAEFAAEAYRRPQRRTFSGR